MSNMNGIQGSPLLQTLMTQTDGVGSSKKAADGAAATTQVSATARDSAQVSTAANALLQQTAGDDVRAEKVAAIQAAMANGTYSVSASDVADKLMQNLLNGHDRG